MTSTENLAAADTTPAYAVVRPGDGRTAIYRRATETTAWDLVGFETGRATNTILMLRSAGASVETHPGMLHVLVDGEFPKHLDGFTAPTAVGILLAKIGVLRKEAKERREAAGWAGEHGDRGASLLTERADAYEEAIKMFEDYPAI